MTGEIKIFRQGCSVVITTTADSIANVTGVEHHFVSNGQIKVGQQISFTGYTGSAKVNAVEDVVYSGNRRTKVTLDTSTTIDSGTTVTFTSLDDTFNVEGRVGDTSVLTITVEREIGRILSPNPIIDFHDVSNMNDYKVVTTDTFENTTELIKRVYAITHKVGLKKLKRNDVINIKALTSVDVTGSSSRIYGYQLLAKPPGKSLEELSISAANSNKDLTMSSLPTTRNINKNAETRLLVVFGDPGATFTLSVLSGLIAFTTLNSVQSAATTLIMGSGSDVSTVNKGMEIVFLSSTTIATPTPKVVSKSTTANPDTITFDTAQALASTETMKLQHVLVASGTKTIASNGIYTQYINFPKNSSDADIDFTITLTETSSNSFTGFTSPSTLSVKSLSEEQISPVYVQSVNSVGVQAFQQIQVHTSPPSTGSGTITGGAQNDGGLGSA